MSPEKTNVEVRLTRLEAMAVERFLSYRGVVELTSLSEATIRRLIAAGRFPAPEQVLPGRRVFRRLAVLEAMERLIAQQKRRAGSRG